MDIFNLPLTQVICNLNIPTRHYITHNGLFNTRDTTIGVLFKNGHTKTAESSRKCIGRLLFGNLKKKASLNGCHLCRSITTGQFAILIHLQANQDHALCCSKSIARCLFVQASSPNLESGTNREHSQLSTIQACNQCSYL